MRVFLALLGLGVTLPTALFAQAETSAPAPSPPSDADRMICRREMPSGSRIPSRKVCLTRGQWVERDRIERDAAGKMMRDSQGRPPGS